ncbi:MAG: hypothetical protein GXP14_04430 [Gammaproteobacteria bacterium]|nr:hypothetical protein [Gammaproteobacteria bacterium]
MMYEFYYSDLDNEALIQARVEQEAEALHQHRQHDDPTSPLVAAISLNIQDNKNCQN